MTAPAFGSPSLQLAASLLAAEGFVVRREELVVEGSDSDGPLEILLAENALFVMAAAFQDTLAQLRMIEPALSAYLAEALAEANDLGDKAWDGYVVLLTGEKLADLEDGSELHELVYDTRYVRRLVRLDVRENLESVSEALRPFLRLRRLDLQEIVVDVLSDLTDALATEGVPRPEAMAAVEGYRSRGRNA